MQHLHMAHLLQQLCHSSEAAARVELLVDGGEAGEKVTDEMVQFQGGLNPVS